MKKVPFTNTGKTPIYSSDGQLVQPGESCMVTVFAEAEAGEATPEPDPLLGLLDNGVKDIVPHLVNLDIEALDRLLEAEKAGKTRKSLIEALELRKMEAEDAAKLAAAETAMVTELAAGDIDAAIAAVPGLAPASLKQLQEIEEAKGDAARAELVDAIEARLAALEAADSGA